MPRLGTTAKLIAAEREYYRNAAGTASLRRLRQDRALRSGVASLVTSMTSSGRSGSGFGMAECGA